MAYIHNNFCHVGIFFAAALQCNNHRTPITLIITGYNQSVTGFGSQRRQCSCYSTKTHVNSTILN